MYHFWQSFLVNMSFFSLMIKRAFSRFKLKVSNFGVTVSHFVFQHLQVKERWNYFPWHWFNEYRGKCVIFACFSVANFWRILSINFCRVWNVLLMANMRKWLTCSYILWILWASKFRNFIQLTLGIYMKNVGKVGQVWRVCREDKTIFVLLRRITMKCFIQIGLICGQIWHFKMTKYVFWLDTQSVKVWWRFILLKTNAFIFVILFWDINQVVSI